MNDNISDKDKKDWNKFINSTEKLPKASVVIIFCNVFILKEIHNTVYIGEGQNKFNVVEKIANDYIDRYGAQNHYYYQ